MEELKEEKKELVKREASKDKQLEEMGEAVKELEEKVSHQEGQIEKSEHLGPTTCHII